MTRIERICADKNSVKTDQKDPLAFSSGSFLIFLSALIRPLRVIRGVRGVRGLFSISPAAGRSTRRAWR